tara:strand:- start:617 stop:1249 length:633 start_codon:yes stop_codon:yes gene_type:complete
MPIDPQTGESLPYAGEPGAPADAPPMPAEAAPPGGEMPPGQEEISPEMQQMMAVAEAAPVPEKPYTVKVIEGLVKVFNKTLSKLAGGDIPEIVVDFEGAEKGKWPNQLPPEIFLPLVAISEAVKVIGGGEYADKYGFDPMEIDSDTQVRKAAAQITRMGKDKKFIDAFDAPPEAAPVEEGQEMPPPMTDAMSEEDQELAAGMETSAAPPV